MLPLLLIILIALWFLGYIHISGFIPNFPLFSINNHSISLWDILILLAIGWAIGILPSPLRQIAAALLVIWLLATFGIIAISGLAQVIVLAIIAGVILALLDIV